MKFCWVAVLVVAGLVQLHHCMPADKTSSSTTEKPIKHPSYVRVLKRGKGSEAADAPTINGTEETKDNVVEAKEDSTPEVKTKQLSTDDIRGIIPYLNFEEGSNGNSRSRGASTDGAEERQPSGIFGAISRVFQGIRNLGEGRSASRTTPRFRITAAQSRNSTLSGAASSVSTVSATTNATSTESPSPSRGPGGILLAVMKALQSMTATVESMVMNFVKLFDLSGSSRNNKP